MEQQRADGAYKNCRIYYYLYGYFKDGASFLTYFMMVGFSFGAFWAAKSIVFPGEETIRSISAQYTLVSMNILFMTYPVCSNRKMILEIARNLDVIPKFDVPWSTMEEYEHLWKETKNSNTGKYLKIQKYTMFISNFLHTIRPFVFHYVLGKPLKTPTSARPENVYLFATLFLADEIAVWVVNNACVTTLEIFSTLILNLKVHFELIEMAILETSYKNRMDVLLHQIINHHQKLLRIYDDIKSIFQTLFCSVYFALFATAAVTRGTLVDALEFDVLLMQIMIVVVTTLYLLPFCLVMESLMDANRSFQTAFYRCNWLKYPRKTCNVFYFAMLRSSRDLTISIYNKGPSLDLQSYAAIINATFTFCITAIID